MKFDALVVAGAKNNGALKDYSNKEYESLIEIAGKPMVQHVIEAVENVGEISDIVIVGPEKINQKINSHYKIIEPENVLINNIKKGIDALNNDHHILIITSDIPLITTKTIEDFIEKCKLEKKHDLFYPIISKDINLDSYPEVDRTYVHLKEGIFTGGNIILVSPDIIQGPLDWYDKILNLRKKPFKMSQMLGFKFIIKFIFRQLSIIEVEKRISNIIGHKCKALIVESPEMGFDVDKPSDLKMMKEKYLKEVDI
ncbi:MAG: NTP transferase domain-containing protein [Halanaerobiales bacterium]|nr:NTP transferase domain-containing protein [Halanaerobiales bacterium]